MVLVSFGLSLQSLIHIGDHGKTIESAKCSRKSWWVEELKGSRVKQLKHKMKRRAEISARVIESRF